MATQAEIEAQKELLKERLQSNDLDGAQQVIDALQGGPLFTEDLSGTALLADRIRALGEQTRGLPASESFTKSGAFRGSTPNPFDVLRNRLDAANQQAFRRRELSSREEQARQERQLRKDVAELQTETTRLGQIAGAAGTKRTQDIAKQKADADRALKAKQFAESQKESRRQFDTSMIFSKEKMDTNTELRKEGFNIEREKLRVSDEQFNQQYNEKKRQFDKTFGFNERIKDKQLALEEMNILSLIESRKVKDAAAQIQLSLNKVRIRTDQFKLNKMKRELKLEKASGAIKAKLYNDSVAPLAQRIDRLNSMISEAVKSGLDSDGKEVKAMQKSLKSAIRSMRRLDERASKEFGFELPQIDPVNR